MKILLISNLYEPYSRGGAEIIVKRTALALSRAGHEVVMLTARPYGGVATLGWSEEEREGLRILRFYPMNLFFYPRDQHHRLPMRLFWHAFDQFNRHSAKITRRVLASEKPDLVVTHNLIGLGFTIPKVILRAGITHIHVLHDIQLAVRSGLMRLGEERRFYTSGWLAKAYQSVARKQIGSPDVVVSPSQFLLDFYRTRYFFPTSVCQVLRNPVDATFYAPKEHKKGVEFHLAYIGQLAEHKGLSVLREAMRLIPDAKLRLHVVGSGPMADSMAEWVAQDPRVLYEGSLPNEAVGKVLASMDAVVLPTQTYENSPTVVYESLAAGVPVIVSDIGGAAEVVQEGVNGFRVPAADAKALARCIAEAAGQREKLSAMQKACRDSVAGLDADTYAERFISLVLRDQNDR
jgi:glycosyltransferase involved in cell wall biosynthesis